MVVILVHSVYHIFYALSISLFKNFSDVIIVCSNSNPHKFDSLFEIINKKFGFKIYKITHDDKASKINDIDKEIISKLKSTKPDEFIIFNQDNLLAIVLADHFHKKNILVSLAQDGTKAYATVQKSAILYKIDRTKNFYKFLYLNGFIFFPFFTSLAYANHKFIDKIYASFSETTTAINKIKEDVNLDPLVLDYFDLLVSLIDINFDRKSIFFASSLLKYNKLQIDKEIEILNHINSKYSDFQKIIKVHPRVDIQVCNELQEKTKDWIFVNDVFPAEIILNKLKDYYLFSAYSSVALFNPREGCHGRKFWLYPLYNDLLKSLTYTKINLPTKEIIVIKYFHEMNNLDTY